MTEPNPMQKLLRRQMGIDSFSLDGDPTEMWENWTDQPRRKGRPPAAP